MHLKLHNEILDFHNFVKANSEDVLKKKLVVKKLRSVIKELYPEAKVLVFGSCATDLNLPNSDVDLLVYNPKKSEYKMIKDITSELVNQKIPGHIEPITTSKVPIIKMEDKETKVHVDISFNRTNGIYCVKLVLKLIQKYPELKPLMILLKCFLKSRNLNETYSGGVGSFLLTMMVVSYLQQKYKDGNTERIDLGKHLMDFLFLYGVQFNYEEVGISVRKGGFYFGKMKRGWMDTRNPFKLSVENP